jgi:hexosaminidase
MTEVAFRLENSWHPIEGDQGGGFIFTLVNLSDQPIQDFKLAYTTLTRVKSNPVCDNAVFLKRNANFHQFAPLPGFVLQPGQSWRFTVQGLWRPAKHRTDGAKSAYLTLANNQHVAVAVDDLMLEGRKSTAAPPLLPKGALSEPFFLLPWPAEVALNAGEHSPVALSPADGTALDDLQAIQSVNLLYRRLFNVGHVPFSLTAVQQGQALVLKAEPALAADAYTITFGEQITLSYGGAPGRHSGLTALAGAARSGTISLSSLRHHHGSAALSMARLPSGCVAAVL